MTSYKYTVLIQKEHNSEWFEFWNTDEIAREEIRKEFSDVEGAQEEFDAAYSWKAVPYYEW